MPILSNLVIITVKQGTDFGNVLNITSPTDNSLVTNKLNTFRTQGLLSDYPTFTLSWSVPTNLGTVQGSTSSYKVDIKLSELATNGTITFQNNHQDCPAAQYPLGVVTKTLNINTYNTPPTVPNNLVVVQNNLPTPQLNLTWTASTDNTGIKQYKITALKQGNTIPKTKLTTAVVPPAIAPTAIALSLSDLQEGDGIYTISVLAIDYNDVESSASQSVIYTFDTTPPAAPTDFRVVSRTSNRTFLEWKDGGDLVGTTSYDIYVNGTLAHANIPGVNNTYSISNPVLASSQTFFTVSIKAKDAKGNISQASAGLQVDKVPPINIDDATGYVGIGVVPPTERLHVAGNLKIEDGTLLFKGTPPLGTHIKAEVGDLKIGSNINLTALAANTPNRITYNGSSLEFFTPVQAEWNGNKPVFSLSQYGEIEFNSSPVLNYNTILLKGKNDYNNGLRFGNSFGGTTGFDGPMLYGNNGGILGTNNTNNNNAGSNVALKWDATGKVGIGVTGALTEKLEVNGNVKLMGGLYMKNAFQPNAAYYETNNFISFGHPGVSEDFIGYKSNTFYMMDSDGGGDVTHPDLVVGGNIRALRKIAATEVIVNTTATIPDYVFEKDYKLPTLAETQNYLDANKHLPYLKSAKELEKDGVNLMEMNTGMLRQIEELYLHVIRLETELKELKELKKNR